MKNGIFILKNTVFSKPKLALSFLDYMGRRISRGMFRSAEGILINSDMNGGYNIIRKSDPEVFVKAETDGVGGCGLHPVRYYI